MYHKIVGAFGRWTKKQLLWKNETPRICGEEKQQQVDIPSEQCDNTLFTTGDELH